MSNGGGGDELALVDRAIVRQVNAAVAAGAPLPPTLLTRIPVLAENIRLATAALTARLRPGAPPAPAPTPALKALAALTAQASSLLPLLQPTDPVPDWPLLLISFARALLAAIRLTQSPVATAQVHELVTLPLIGCIERLTQLARRCLDSGQCAFPNVDRSALAGVIAEYASCLGCMTPALQVPVGSLRSAWPAWVGWACDLSTHAPSPASASLSSPAVTFIASPVPEWLLQGMSAEVAWLGGMERIARLSALANPVLWNLLVGDTGSVPGQESIPVRVQWIWTLCQYLAAQFIPARAMTLVLQSIAHLGSNEAEAEFLATHDEVALSYVGGISAAMTRFLREPSDHNIWGSIVSAVSVVIATSIPFSVVASPEILSMAQVADADIPGVVWGWRVATLANAVQMPAPIWRAFMDNELDLDDAGDAVSHGVPETLVALDALLAHVDANPDLLGCDCCGTEAVTGPNQVMAASQTMNALDAVLMPGTILTPNIAQRWLRSIVRAILGARHTNTALIAAAVLSRVARCAGKQGLDELLVGANLSELANNPRHCLVLAALSSTTSSSGM
ncbi:hypothetical protein BC828DRAFT_374421 [Blastocladiella britannica]|nr:hypothetical protein BC828DRAFT_374421 [Blastocladiella britannica]